MTLTDEQVERQDAEMFRWLCDAWTRNDLLKVQSLIWNSRGEKEFIKNVQAAMKELEGMRK